MKTREDEINYLIDEVNKLKEKKNLKCSNNYDIIKKRWNNYESYRDVAHFKSTK